MKEGKLTAKCLLGIVSTSLVTLAVLLPNLYMILVGLYHLVTTRAPQYILIITLGALLFGSGCIIIYTIIYHIEDFEEWLNIKLEKKK